MHADWDRINRYGYALETVLGLLALVAAGSALVLSLVIHLERDIPPHVWRVVACEEDATLEADALLQLAGEENEAAQPETFVKDCAGPSDRAPAMDQGAR